MTELLFSELPISSKERIQILARDWNPLSFYWGLIFQFRVASYQSTLSMTWNRKYGKEERRNSQGDPEGKHNAGLDEAKAQKRWSCKVNWQFVSTHNRD